MRPQSAQVQTDEGRNDSRQEESFSVQTLPSEEVQTEKTQVQTQEAEMSAKTSKMRTKEKVSAAETKVQEDESRDDPCQEKGFSVQTLPSEEVQAQAKEEVPTEEAEVSANKEAQMCAQKAKVPTKETKVSTKEDEGRSDPGKEESFSVQTVPSEEVCSQEEVLES